MLDKNDDGLLFVISDKVLDVKPYNTTSISITWDKSTIRSWLNGYAASYNSQHGLLRHPPRHVGSVMVITSGQLSCFMALLIQFK